MKKYKIIDKINNNIMVFDSDIERGFTLDYYLESRNEFLYNWIDYTIKTINNNIIIDYKKNKRA